MDLFLPGFQFWLSYWLEHYAIVYGSSFMNNSSQVPVAHLTPGLVSHLIDGQVCRGKEKFYH